ncbi:hypothetical protein LJR029_005482 [Caballeronia sp. LjRoot29]|uniref:hypothetical protein n=1 Tax=Caballeronia sp. LjRoot29 TaxID=3342315 RepID=UPI003ECF5BA4
MKTYALIVGGLVVEIIAPETWPDGSEIPIEDRFTPDIVASLVDVTSEIPSPGQKAVEISSGVWSFSAPAVPVQSISSLANLAMSIGLTISSASTPALNGTYAIDAISQMDIIAVETSLNAGKGFPGGASTFNYADISGAFRPFTAANFTDFAAAVRDYVYALKAVIAGASTTLPAATSTIT